MSTSYCWWKPLTTNVKAGSFANENDHKSYSLQCQFKRKTFWLRAISYQCAHYEPARNVDTRLVNALSAIMSVYKRYTKVFFSPLFKRLF